MAEYRLTAEQRKVALADVTQVRERLRQIALDRFGATCGAGIPDCDCDYNTPSWIAEMRDKGIELQPVNEFCECHDCYVCGAIDCDGHDDA